MILKGEGWIYLAVKNLSALLREIMSKHDDDFIPWISFICLEQKTNLYHLKNDRIKIFVII